MTTLASPTTPSTRQSLILAVMGAIFWFAAALVVRWTAADWAGRDGPTALMFVLIVVSTPPLLWLGLKVAGLGRAHAEHAATVMVGIAALLDALALTWFRALYGIDPATVLAGAAAILWGAGVALVMGIVVGRRATL